MAGLADGRCIGRARPIRERPESPSRTGQRPHPSPNLKKASNGCAPSSRGATSAPDHPRGPLFAQRSRPRPPSEEALRVPGRPSPGGSPPALTRASEGHRRPARTRSAGASPPPKSDQLAPAPGAGLRGTRSAGGAEAASSTTAEAHLRRRPARSPAATAEVAEANLRRRPARSPAATAEVAEAHPRRRLARSPAAPTERAEAHLRRLPATDPGRRRDPRTREARGPVFGGFRDPPP